MGGPRQRTCAWVLPILIASTPSAALAVSQETDSPDPGPPRALAQAGVAVGDVVLVLDGRGDPIKGRLVAVTDEAVEVRSAAGLRSVAAADVRRIEWQPSDSPLTGILIGAAVGSVPGLYWLAADPNECRGLCAEEYALVAIGAVVGGLIDHAIRKKVTVYSAPSHTATSRVSVSARLSPARQGVRVVVRF